MGINLTSLIFHVSVMKGFVIFLTLRDSGEGLNVKIDHEVVREICVELPKLSFATLTLTIATPVVSLEPKNYPKNGHFSEKCLIG